MLKVRPDKPVAPTVLQLMAHADRATKALGLKYFVAGAFARDILLTHVHGIALPAPTKDVDLGIAVGSWDDFHNLKNRLIATNQFSAVAGIAHRLLYKANENAHGIPLDIIPFAGVGDLDANFAWPPDGAIVMNVSGFEEGLASAGLVQLDGNLTVPVVSLPGLALLKLFAWVDRHEKDPRDARDLLILLRQYGDAGNQDRLYGSQADLLASVGFDVERAGSILLGRDVRAVAKPRSLEALTKAFVSPRTQEAFVTQVTSSAMITGYAATIDKAETLVEEFFQGFRPLK